MTANQTAVFDDLIAANRRYREDFDDSGVAGAAAKGLADLTCFDSRIGPLAMLGLATATQEDDLDRLHSCALFPPSFVVGGFIFDVHGGELVPVPS